jgi:hypothetical protein
MDDSEKKLDKIMTSIEGMSSSISDIKTEQAVQGIVLKEHERRSTASEENLALLRAQIKPLEDHVSFARGVGKAISILLTLGGIIAGILKLMK